jgi:hypothetical protein
MLLGGAMISALLLPLLFTGAAAQSAAATRDDPPIRLWISNDRRFLPGDRAKVQVRTEYDGYLLVLHVDPEGRVRVLFPLDPDKDNFVRGGKKYEVRGRGGREAFEVDGKGRGAVYAAVSRDPFRFEGNVVGDHWDYRALAPSRLADDPEPELNELVQRIAQSSFDYDMLSYEVADRSAYASTYYPSYYGSGYGNPYGYPYYRSPYGLSVGFFFGSPHRRHYYRPYYSGYDPFYSPFHSPFFYDPYYYAPAYYPTYGYPGRSYGYQGGYYWGRNRLHNQPYTPYRLRGSDGITTGYRGRYDLRRSINTVYNPPVSRIREPVTSTPMRRLIEGPPGELPNGVAPRRAVEHQQRVGPEKVEARRAREREEPRSTPPGDVRGRERSGGDARSAPRREIDTPRDDRNEPRLERRREDSRQVEREPARAVPEARPARREVERSAPPREARGGEGRSSGGGGRAEGRSSGGSRSGGASSPSGGGSHSGGASRPSGGGSRSGGASRPSGGGSRRR